MINLSPDMPWDALRVPHDQLRSLPPDVVDLTPLIIVEFGGFEGVKPRKQSGECNARLATVGKNIASLINGRFVHEQTSRYMKKGVEEHIDGRAQVYHQINSACADDLSVKTMPHGSFATEFTVHLRGFPEGLYLGDLFIGQRVSQSEKAVIASEYGEPFYVNRPIDHIGEKANPHRQYLSDRIQPFDFTTLNYVTETVLFGDVAVFFNGIGLDNESRIFPSHGTRTMKYEAESGMWLPTYSCPRSIALGRVVPSN